MVNTSWIQHINTDWMGDRIFQEAYCLGRSTLSILDKKYRDLFLYDLWLVYIVCWVANYCKDLPGDFVECGVNTGFLSRALIHYTGFQKLNKKLFLLDTFCGIPTEQISYRELKLGRQQENSVYSRDIFEEVKFIFKDFCNVTLIKGSSP